MLDDGEQDDVADTGLVVARVAVVWPEGGGTTAADQGGQLGQAAHRRMDGGVVSRNHLIILRKRQKKI